MTVSAPGGTAHAAALLAGCGVVSQSPGEHRSIGDTKPKYLIKCNHSSPFGVAVDASSNIWVTEDHHSAVVEYASTDQLCPTPRSFIRGSATGLAEPTGIAVDSTGRIIVDDPSTNAVEVFAA